MRPRFLGPEDADIDRLASPMNHVSANAPPFLIAYGTEDFPHLREQGERMVEALSAAGGATEKVVLEGRDHFGASLAGGEPDGPWVPRAIDWMKKV